MLIAVSGDLLETPGSLMERQAPLDLVKHAWNSSMMTKEQVNYELKVFLKKLGKVAASVDAIKGLEWEYRRTIKRKITPYPIFASKGKHAEAIDTSKDN